MISKSERPNPNIERLKKIFIGLFVLGVVGVVAWQVGWVMPGDRCESGGKWWDNYERTCAQPVLISDITGRTLADKAKEAEARKALGRPAAKTAP